MQFIRLFSLLLLILGCNQQARFTHLEGTYLGQKSPGTTASLFAPGIISNALNERDQTISPDLNEFIFAILENPHNVLVSVKYENNRWTLPEVLPFSGKYNDCEPSFSPDGKRLYFCSDRPLIDGDKPKDYDIWFVERAESGWGVPQNPGAPLNTEKNEFYPSVTNSGCLYFTSHDMKIKKSNPTHSGYSTPEVLSDSVNSGTAEYNAFIAADESYLIFTSHGWPGGRKGRGDLFISFRKPDNTWSRSQNLGTGINSTTTEMSPAISPDGKYLFFSSRRALAEYDPEPVRSYSELYKKSNGPGNGKSDIYWVETTAIDSLKSIMLK